MTSSTPPLTGRLAAYSAMFVPAMLLATDAAADIYSQTGLSLRIGSGGTDTTLTITGAGSASVGQINLASLDNSYAQISGEPFYFRMIRQAESGSSWWGGVPVGAGATWSNLGRTASEFPGSNISIFTGFYGDINWGTNPSGPIGLDPQQVGNAGTTWYLLFKFASGSATGNYGWLSFDANVSSTSNSNSYITITGWGWDDSGNTIAAGSTAGPAVPGVSGLAALAIGAAGIRGRRRSVA